MPILQLEQTGRFQELGTSVGSLRRARGWLGTRPPVCAGPVRVSVRVPRDLTIHIVKTWEEGAARPLVLDTI